jgi:PAS domain S-box-containing protein
VTRHAAGEFLIMIIIELIYNLALLIALSGIISAFFDQRRGLRRSEKILQGLLFGTIATIVMMNRPASPPGVMLDGHSIIISTCGLFFGSLSVFIAGGMAMIYRLIQSDAGIYTGALSVVFPAFLGLLFNALWIRKNKPLAVLHLWVFGLIVHVVMLLLLFTLPLEQALPALRAVSAPYLVAFPLASLLVGRILFGLKERTHFLDALQQSKEEIRTTLYSIGDAVISTDHKGRVRQMNPVAEQLTGWLEAEARDNPLSSVFHIIDETTRNVLPDPAQRVLYASRQQELEKHTLLISRDGTEHPVADSAAPIRDAKGKITGVVLVFRDQTQERETRKLLDRQNSQLTALLQNLPIGVFMFEAPSGDLLVANEAAQQILGRKYLADITAAQLVKSYQAYKMPERIPYPPEAMPIALGMQGKKAHVDDMLVVRPDHTECHLEVFGSPVFNEQGEQWALLICFLDITGRMLAEAEHKELKEQFRQSQKIEAIGRLAGGVAHDFNNMLQVILGRTELLLRSAKLETAQTDGLKEISKAAQRSADLTRQLLAFARKQTIAPTLLNLNDAIHNTLSMLRRLIGENIELRWDPSDALWSVKMDPSQLTQILTNLTINAQDAIRGSGQITIQTGKAEFNDTYCRVHAGFLPGEYILLAVSDNGCGMDKETCSQIFEPFFTTKPTDQHSGLGLSTLYGIVRQNDGFVNVYSEVGKGTTFRIYLPRHTADAAAQPQPARQVESPTGRETVLLVEDEEALLALAKEQLEELGYKVLASTDAEKALGIAEVYGEEIHLLLTDSVMPKMSGLELSKRVTALRPQIESLFMSGYPANVIAHHGILDENIHFLQKPFSQETLAKKIRDVLAG